MSQSFETSCRRYYFVRNGMFASYPEKLLMRGIKATNLVNKEVLVQTKLKMDLSKLRH